MKTMTNETKNHLIKLNRKIQELLDIKDKTDEIENEIKNLNFQINSIILTYRYSK